MHENSHATIKLNARGRIHGFSMSTLTELLINNVTWLVAMVTLQRLITCARSESVYKASPVMISRRNKMNTYNRNEDLSISQDGVNLQPIMRQVYLWMGLGTLITAFMAYFTVSTPLVNLAANPIILMVAMLLELGLVMGISLGFSRISSGMATALFFLYAALNGFTLSMVLMAFTTGSVLAAFVSTSALFGAMTILGYTTRVDLTKMGTFLIMGVFGLLIAMVVNMFINSGPLNLIISMAGVLIFTGLTAYDTQRIGRMAAQMGGQGGEAAAKVAIMGALKLYLDFINMFLFMLRLFGRRR